MKRISFSGKIDILSFGLMAVVLIVIGIMGNAFSDNFTGNACKTEARICDIDVYTERNYKGRKVRKHKVYVDYTVDGIIYDHVLLDNYNSSMKVGSVIEIYYNPKNPGRISKGDKTVYIFAICGGVFLAGVAVFKIIIARKKENGQQEQIRNTDDYQAR
ncbi:MAG: DUF3592 domain-containing protein [Ruminiclostridium sp.]|nr:DUF3592 domain-containing protein [Ruminiclostridium sp.]